MTGWRRETNLEVYEIVFGVETSSCYTMGSTLRNNSCTHDKNHFPPTVVPAFGVSLESVYRRKTAPGCLGIGPVGGVYAILRVLIVDHLYLRNHVLATNRVPIDALRSFHTS